MTRTKKKLLGAVTMWPLFYMGLFMFFMLSQFVLIAVGGSLGDKQVGETLGLVMVGSFGVIFVLHFLTIFGSMALMVYYIFHVFNNPRLDDDKNTRLLWALVIFFGNFLAMPIYWYINIWKEPEGPSDDGTDGHFAPGSQN